MDAPLGQPDRRGPLAGGVQDLRGVLGLPGHAHRPQELTQHPHRADHRRAGLQERGRDADARAVQHAARARRGNVQPDAQVARAVRRPPPGLRERGAAGAGHARARQPRRPPGDHHLRARAHARGPRGVGLRGLRAPPQHGGLDALLPGQEAPVAAPQRPGLLPLARGHQPQQPLSQFQGDHRPRARAALPEQVRPQGGVRGPVARPRPEHHARGAQDQRLQAVRRLRPRGPPPQLALLCPSAGAHGQHRAALRPRFTFIYILVFLI